MIKKKAIIISLKGTKLSPKEKKLIICEKPWGIILFKRNISSLDQLKKLITLIKKITKDRKFPILIDEEGGTVSRLSKIIKNNYSQSFFGKLYEKKRNFALIVYKNYIDTICQILFSLGININTVPVLDLLQKQTHKIIQTRCYSKNIKTVKYLGDFCVRNYKKNKISTVVKHIPGHGAANTDSHITLPTVNKSNKKLNSSDFLCFKSINSHFAMTAHILYRKVDNTNVCTFSKKIIKNIIRKKMGFKGILISDDISMKALKYDLLTNAKKSLNAGCNLVLYCGGKYQVSMKLIKNIPYIDEFTQKKTSEFYKFLS